MSGLNGKVINLMSFDSYRFDGIIALLHYLWKGPIEVVVFGYFLYLEIGYYGWIGIGFILCFIPIQSEYIELQNTMNPFNESTTHTHKTTEN